MSTLRLLPTPDAERSYVLERPTAGRPPLRLVEERSPLLIAGADPLRRAVLLQELTETMPVGTDFEQAGTLAEVLERAPSSRMVILSGPLDDTSQAALKSRLSRRHPRLPLVMLDS
jgi:hypothetical protein